MGKRLAGKESFQGNISSILREVTGLYAKKGMASYDNRTEKDSRENSEGKQIAHFFFGGESRPWMSTPVCRTPSRRSPSPLQKPKIFVPYTRMNELAVL